MENNKFENEELIKKLRDPKKYLESFTKIKPKTPGALVPFILKEAQKDLFNTLKKHNRVIILKARQLGFCGSPDTKILTSELRWITLRDIKKGQKIVAVDEFPKKGRGNGRKMKTAIVEKKCSIYENAFELTMDDGRNLIFTGDHRFLSKKNGSSETIWKKVKDFKIGNEIRYITKPWGDPTFEDGWFSGMIDGEGSLSKKSRTGVSLLVSQVEGFVWDRLLNYVSTRGYSFQIEWDRRKSCNSSKFGDKPVGKVVIGRMDEMFKLLGQLRPSRIINRNWWENKDLPGKCSGIGWSKVVKIELLPRQEMIDLQTSEKTYIANGFVSHNSTATVGWIYHDTIMNPGTTSALIGYNSDLTAELLDKVKTLYNTTPEELRPTIQYNSKSEISFPKINSKILVLPSTVNVGKGYTISNCLCTELSSWEDAEEKMMTLEASVPINGKIIVESTPRGQGNHYHLMWSSEDNDYAKKRYGWWWEYCLDDDTEILTIDGWKKREAFNVGDKHFTINLKTKKLEIKVATNKIDHKFNGEMIHFESQNLDMLVTLNHRCIIQTSAEYQTKNGGWILKQANDISKLDYIPLSTLGWDENKVKKYNDKFVELVGWVITEASFERYLIYVYQNIGENLDRIENLCKSLGYKYTRYIRKNKKCGEIRIHSKYTKKIRKVLNGKCKSLPMKFLLKLTNDQLILLQRTMVMADGHIDSGLKKTLELCDNKCCFVQKDKQVSDNFQILTTLIGNSSRIQQNKTTDKCYKIRVKQDKVAQKFSKKYEKYNGHIWCPTNENGTIIIRRNGKVMLTGQSREEIELIRKRMNNPMLFSQEYGLEFLSSGRSVFDQNIIKEQRKNVLKVGDEVLDNGTKRKVYVEDDLRIYKEPQAGKYFILGADVSEGVEGGDYSVATIWDRETGEEVAMYRGLIPPDIFGEKLNKWGRKYNNALMVVEVNNHGLTTLTVLKQKLYPSLYFRLQKIESIGVSSSDKLGWKTTKVTRPLMIDELAQACRDKDLTIHSKELLDEMTVFVYDDSGNMSCPRNWHDDVLFSSAIAFQGFKVVAKEKPEQLDYRLELPQNFAY